MVERPKRKGRAAKRKFTDQFKAGVVQLVCAGGTSIREVAQNLEIAEAVIRSWVKRGLPDDRAAPPEMPTKAEEKRLRKEHLYNLNRDLATRLDDWRAAQMVRQF